MMTKPSFFMVLVYYNNPAGHFSKMYHGKSLMDLTLTQDFAKHFFLLKKLLDSAAAWIKPVN